MNYNMNKNTQCLACLVRRVNMLSVAKVGLKFAFQSGMDSTACVLMFKQSSTALIHSGLIKHYKARILIS